MYNLVFNDVNLPADIYSCWRIVATWTRTLEQSKVHAKVYAEYPPSDHVSWMSIISTLIRDLTCRLSRGSRERQLRLWVPRSAWTTPATGPSQSMPQIHSQCINNVAKWHQSILFNPSMKINPPVKHTSTKSLRPLGCRVNRYQATCAPYSDWFTGPTRKIQHHLSMGSSCCDQRKWSWLLYLGGQMEEQERLSQGGSAQCSEPIAGHAFIRALNPLLSHYFSYCRKIWHNYHRLLHRCRMSNQDPMKHRWMKIGLAVCIVAESWLSLCVT